MIFAVLLLAALPFALKGLMWWRIKFAVDDFIARTSDQAVIDYRTIETGWDGTASILGIRLRPRSFDHPITIGKIRLETADPVFLLYPRRWFNDARSVPEQLALAAYEVRLPLDEIQAQQLRTTGTDGSEESACSNFTLEPKLLQGLGMNDLTLDLHSRYAFDRTARRLEMQLLLDLHDVERMELQMQLRDLLPEDLQGQGAAQARLDNARLLFEIDPAFGQRLSRHCARQLGLSGPEAYVERQITQTRTQLAAAGIELGDALQQALADYQYQWGRLALEIHPPEPLAPLQLVSIPPEQIITRLGLSLTVNGHPVKPLELRFRVPAPVATPGTPSPQSGHPQTPPGFRIQHRFRTTPVDRLADHLGRKVRIQPQGQPLREGVLMAIVDGKVQLEQRVPGGTMEAYVPLDEILSLEVEERIKVPRTPRSGTPSVPAK